MDAGIAGGSPKASNDPLTNKLALLILMEQPWDSLAPLRKSVAYRLGRYYAMPRHYVALVVAALLILFGIMILDSEIQPIVAVAILMIGAVLGIIALLEFLRNNKPH
jgi:hypothetical protein